MASPITTPTPEPTTLSSTLTSSSSFRSPEATALTATAPFSSLLLPEFTSTPVSNSSSASSATIVSTTSTNYTFNNTPSSSFLAVSVSTSLSASFLVTTSSILASTTSSPPSYSVASEATSTSPLLSTASAHTNNSSHPLSTGGKAGIALAVILFLSVLGCIAAFLVLKKRRPGSGINIGRGGVKRESFILGSGSDGTGIHTGVGMAFGGSEMGKIGTGHGMVGIQRVGSGRDELGKVGRYEDAERGLPLPRTDRDGERSGVEDREGGRRRIRESFGDWREKGGLGRAI